jgi:hypothetical protein
VLSPLIHDSNTLLVQVVIKPLALERRVSILEIIVRPVTRNRQVLPQFPISYTFNFPALSALLDICQLVQTRLPQIKCFHGDSWDVAPLPTISVYLVFTTVTKDIWRIRNIKYRHFKLKAYFMYYFLTTSHHTEETKQCVSCISAYSVPR